MNIHQSSAIRECFNTLLQYEQNIYFHFNNLVYFIHQRSMYGIVPNSIVLYVIV